MALSSQARILLNNLWSKSLLLALTLLCELLWQGMMGRKRATPNNRDAQRTITATGHLITDN